MSTTTPCSWYGVSCAAGHVTSLTLTNNALSGPISPAVDDLDNVIIFDLSQNALTGAIPTELTTMTNVQYVYLNQNQLTSIPPGITSMSGLLKLRLHTNLFTGSILAQFGTMSSLIELDLGNNALGGTIPTELGGMTALWILKLNNTGLTGTIPAALTTLPALQTLDLSNNQLAGTIPTGIGSLTTLTNLALGGNLFDGSIPSQIGSLTGLTTLKLQNNALAGDVPATITNLTSLVYNQLDIGYNMLTPPSTAVRTFLNTRDPDWLLTQTVPPTGVTATPASTTSVTVSWFPILYTGDGGYYEVWYKLASGGTYAAGCTSTNKTTTTCTVPGLAVGTAYKFKVRTYTPAHGSQQNNLWSAYSSEATGSTFTDLVTPTGLSAVGVAANQIDLSWTDPNVDETGYAVERSPDGVSDWEEIIVTAADATSYQDIGLFCETPYTYRVRAYRSIDDVYSGYSNTDSDITLECPTNLVRNPDFSAGESQWGFFGQIWHQVISPNVLEIYRLASSPDGAAVWQLLYYTPPPDASFEVNVDIGNTSSGPRNCGSRCASRTGPTSSRVTSAWPPTRR